MILQFRLCQVVKPEKQQSWSCHDAAALRLAQLHYYPFCVIIASLLPIMTIIMALLLHVFTSLLCHYYATITCYYCNNGPLLCIITCHDSNNGPIITVIMDPLLPIKNRSIMGNNHEWLGFHLIHYYPRQIPSNTYNTYHYLPIHTNTD